MTESWICRAERSLGIDGSKWYPVRDEVGRIVLRPGTTSEEAKHSNPKPVDTEQAAIDALIAGAYWLRMTADETKQKNLTRNILLEGVHLDAWKRDLFRTGTSAAPAAPPHEP